jgi:hypothetical protein
LSGQFDYMGEPLTKVNLLSLVDRESDLLKKLVGLSAVDPAGGNQQQKLPGMENSSHDSPPPKSRGKNFGIGRRPWVVNRPK